MDENDFFIKSVRVLYTDLRDKEGKVEVIKTKDLSENAGKYLNKFFTEYKNENKLNILPFLPNEPKSVLIIGPKLNRGYHFSEKMYKALGKKGLVVEYRDPTLLVKDKNKYQKYKQKRERFRLSNIESKIMPDLVIIDECEFFFENDVDIPVIYYHREFKRPPTVYYPDVVLMWQQNFIDYWEKMFAPEWMHNVKWHIRMKITVDPEMFKPEPKKYTGVIGIGIREAFEDIIKMNELAAIADVILLHEEEKEFKLLGYTYFDPPITDDDYRKIMPKCETCWIPLSTRQYISHRMLECMASKTLCLIKLQNKEHEEALKRMGLKNMVHYIGVDKLEEFRQAYYEITDNEKKEIIENAYRYVLRNLTDDKCAEFILQLAKLFPSNRYDVICPVYFIPPDFYENVKNWFKELPIRQLYIGLGRGNIDHKKILMDLNHPQITIIDQTRIKTLGGCLKDLMERVKTKWFIYLHSDVEITGNAFNVIKPLMKGNVGIIESERIHINEKGDVFYSNYINFKRAFSGFQVIRKEAIQSLLDILEDDYLYRNEDMIFQYHCIKNGFKYIKTYGMHLHKIITNRWSMDKEKAYDMQWKGFVKYTYPNEFTKLYCLRALANMKEEFGIKLEECLAFSNAVNPAWNYEIVSFFLEYKKNKNLTERG